MAMHPSVQFDLIFIWTGKSGCAARDGSAMSRCPSVSPEHSLMSIPPPPAFVLFSNSTPLPPPCRPLRPCPPPPLTLPPRAPSRSCGPATSPTTPPAFPHFLPLRPCNLPHYTPCVPPLPASATVPLPHHALCRPTSPAHPLRPRLPSPSPPPTPPPAHPYNHPAAPISKRLPDAAILL